MTKRVLALCLSVCLILLSCAFAAPQGSDISENAEPSREFIEKQSASLDTYFSVKEELLEAKETYGGIYIDKTGNLNVMVVDTATGTSENTSLRTVKDYQDVIKEHKTDNQHIMYRMVSYSFDYLQTVQSDLLEKFEEFGISSTYIDETENIIVVESADEGFDENQVIEFVGNCDILRFEKITSMGLQSAVVKNGSKLMSSSNKEFSVACGAKLGNDYGFITAAHCIDIGERGYYNGNTIGLATHRNFGGSSDVAFIINPSANFQSTTVFTDGTNYTAGQGYGHPSDYAAYVAGGFPTGTAVTTYGFVTKNLQERSYRLLKM